MNRGIARLIRQRSHMSLKRTIVIAENGAFVSAKNGADFPKLADSPAARALLQDVFDTEPHYNKEISRERT